MDTFSEIDICNVLDDIRSANHFWYQPGMGENEAFNKEVC